MFLSFDEVPFLREVRMPQRFCLTLPQQPSGEEVGVNAGLDAELSPSLRFSKGEEEELSRLSHSTTSKAQVPDG